MKKLKHLKHFEEYKWLDEKEKYWSAEFKKVMDEINEKLLKPVETLVDFNDDSNPDNILDSFVECLTEVFTYIEDEAIFHLKTSEDIEKLITEIELSIPFIFKEYINELKKYERTDGVQKIYEVLFKNLSNLFDKDEVTDELAELYDKELSVDDYREEFKKLLNNFVEKVKTRIESTNVEDIMKTANIQSLDKSVEIVYNAGDEIRYLTSDNKENTAFYSNNQENLKERDNIRLVSKNKGEHFEIKKDKIVEIVKRSGDISNQIKQDLKEVLADKNKVKKVADFLNDLKEEE